MTKFLKLSTFLTFVMLVATPLIWGQTGGFQHSDEFGEDRFSVEAVDFRSDEFGRNIMEIYYKVFYDALSYQKTPDGYQAKYEVAVILEDNKGNQIDGVTKEAQIDVSNFAETRRSTDFVINKVVIKYQPRDIVVKVSLNDMLAGTSKSVKKTVKEHDYWGKYPSLSHVLFAREIGQTEGESKFNKHDLRVIPNVTRLLGGDYDTLLQYYQEIYPSKVGDKFAKVITKIYHRVKQTVYQDTVEIGDADSTKYLFRTINIDAFEPGEYELDVKIVGRRGKVYDELTEEFELELTAETIFRTDCKLAIEMLKYLASNTEQAAFKKAKTPEEQRRLWDEFWSLRSGGSHDRVNPAKAEYFRRVRHANRYFSYLNKEGWRTGRGMIYIKYGEPDEVDDHPFELSSKPYQIWIYYQMNPTRKFLFVDEWGDGNYELKPPYDGVGF